MNKTNQILVVSRDYPHINNNKEKFHHNSIIHDIDTINWILGETPVKVFSTENNNEFAYTILKYKSNINLNIISSRYGSSYQQEITLGKNKNLSIKDNKKYFNFKERYDESYKNELSEFYLDIIKNRDTLITQNNIINNF